MNSSLKPEEKRMDSGNSGSLQSSSGGDEEYDSRADSLSAFINHSVSIPAAQPPPAPPHPAASTSHIFDQLSNYLDPISRPAALQNNPASLLSLDMVWPKNLRSQPCCTDPISINHPMLPSSSATFSSLLQPPFATTFATVSPVVSLPAALADHSANVTSSPRGSSSSTATAAAASSDQAHVVRNPKKRSRASRRAPTTVLTTDTTNFRAMVQEFTGIPAPPFTSSSFPRSRFDIFGTPSTMRSPPSSFDISQPPPYLRRPFAQKIQPQPPPAPPPQPPPQNSSASSSLLNSSGIDALASSSSDLGPLKHSHLQSSNLFNIQNPIFSSLLQSAPTFTQQLTDSSITGSSKEQPLKSSSSSLGILDEFGSISGLPNLISSDQNHQPQPRNPQNDQDKDWRNGGPHVVPCSNNENDHHHHHQHQHQAAADQVRRFNNGNFNFSRNNVDGGGAEAAAKSTGFPATPFTFQSDKGLNRGGGGSRGEGMVEPWMCSSE